MLRILKNKGFTLIEIFVVIVIIVILLAVSFINYRKIEEDFRLNLLANKLAQDIREVQEMAMAADEWDNEVPKGGFGVYMRIKPEPGLDPYILFADNNENKICDCGQDCAGQECIREVDIKERGMKIKEMNLEGGQKTFHLHVIFIPPDPTIIFVGADDNPEDGVGDELNSSYAEVVFCLRDENDECTTRTKTIKINKAGLITVE